MRIERNGLTLLRYASEYLLIPPEGGCVELLDALLLQLLLQRDEHLVVAVAPGLPLHSTRQLTLLPLEAGGIDQTRECFEAGHGNNAAGGLLDHRRRQSLDNAHRLDWWISGSHVVEELRDADSLARGS